MTSPLWFQKTGGGKKGPVWTGFIERIHSHVQQPCKFIETKESVYKRKELNSHRIGFVRRIIVLQQPIWLPYDVMCIRSLPYSGMSIAF